MPETAVNICDDRLASLRRIFTGGCRSFTADRQRQAYQDMTREEFRSTFDCQLYDRVRTAYHAENTFLDVYDKLKRP